MPRSPRPEARQRRLRLPKAAVSLTLAAVCLGGVLGPVGSAVAAETVPAPVLQYSFDALGTAALSNGAVIADDIANGHPGTVVNAGATTVAGPSGASGDRALSLPGGGSNSGAPYVNIAPGLIPAGTTDVTMSAWLLWSGAPQCTWPFTLGSGVNAHVLATTQCGDSGYGAIKNGNEVRASGTAPVPASRWVQMSVVVRGGVSISTFLDGQQIGTAATGYNASAAVGSSTFSGFLGKSFYGADAYWAGAIDNVQVWTSALTPGQLQQSGASIHSVLATKDAAVSLGDTSAVTSNLTLPTTGANGSTITWASSAPGTVSTSGVVTRPASGTPDATLTLTPTATHGGSAVTGSAITVTVKAYAAGDSAQAELARAVAAAVKADPALQGSVRGSLSLPNTGADLDSVSSLSGASSAVIDWSSSAPAVISATDVGTEPNVVKKGSVTRGSADTNVTLTATVRVSGASPVVVTLPLTVLAAAPVSQADLDAYLFVYFTGDNVEGEKLRFATSDGNNALKWKTLNDAQPILTSTKGTQGLRDPYILRSPEGDRFFLIATDLSVGRSGWGGATDNGSHYLEIWESTDLVNWGEQRHVEVNVPKAGMTWAPEATYDPTIDAYVVYWTSSMYLDDARTQPDGNGPQIVTSITRDFRTFTTPQPWFKAADLPSLNKGNGLIDSTVLKEGDQYYRFTKATQNSGCPSPDIIGQRSTDLRATTASGAWSLVDTCIGRTAGTPEVEGPEIFRANPGDASGFKYFLWVDNYGGVGYIPLGTNSLDGDIQWTYPSNFSLPASPRHGSVLAITAKERDALAAKWNPALLVTSVDPVSATVQAGATTVTLPSTVGATFKDGHRETVGVTWATADLSGLKKAGDTVQVKGQLANSAATPAIATITATAPPGIPVTVTAEPRCLAGKVTLTGTAKNTSTVTADLTMRTAWGSKTFASVAPGKTVTGAFSTRAASISAGTLQLTATGVSGNSATGSASAAYPALSCR
ncbi:MULTISPECIES: immunoglobulin-like domain-containing protein [unclassified Rathayibacter]|uniref:immunoglobulin-like domain-containing protein n=1 Tax=unclassified Rathayibacter TaxID=2609250 RepID=UPI00188BB05A|nr:MULTISPECIES: immunoglobulin-like domain-containing protein [unclassified Rathayibacter]MBF4461307.1 family 43 glycosylhydrolase [Rathayibacter sp. VKM Ac-2879]MBF4502718.1 family 43 glycosylhydrolase [Rathayibacter sp. VKM Ac-2878]